MFDDVDGADEIPSKLLDCPECDIRWPDGFQRAGTAIRLDYSTPIHSEIKEFMPYRHRFTTGVDVFGSMDSDRVTGMREDSKCLALEEAYKPILLGVADRLYFATEDGRQIVYARPELGIDEVDVDESYAVIDLDQHYVTWDPEGQQILIVAEDGEVEFAIRGGMLQLSPDAMILG